MRFQREASVFKFIRRGIDWASVTRVKESYNTENDSTYPEFWRPVYYRWSAVTALSEMH